MKRLPGSWHTTARRAARWQLAGAIALAALAVLAPTSARAQSCGDLLIVLDRSGSMYSCTVDGMTKEAMAKAAIKAVVAKYPTMPVGLFVFPDTVDSCGIVCKPGREVVAMKADGGSSVSSYLDKMPRSCGGTPTGDSMLEVAKWEGWSSAKKHYVLLITDSQPTCQDGYEDEAMTKPCDGMGSTSNECKNPTELFDAVKMLYDKGVHTFVVGFAGAGMGGGCGTDGMPFNKDTLNKAADLGGEAATGDVRFYSATDAASLLDALDRIGDRVAGGTVAGCGSSGTGGSGAGGGSGGAGAAGAGGAAGAAGGQGGNAGGSGADRDSVGCGCAAAPSAGRGLLTLAGVLAMLTLGGLRRRGRARLR